MGNLEDELVTWFYKPESTTPKRRDSRCWKGYEPTPNKKPFSKGSCQPVKKDGKEKGKKMADDKIAKVMGEFKRGELKSSSGAEVKGRKQALAIALSEAERLKKKKPSRS